MKNNLLSILAIAICSITLFVGFKSQTSAPATATQFKQITTVESVVPGGLGRSRLISTDSDGELSEEKMKNFFSMVGINFKNIMENDQQITDKITGLTQDGWTLVKVSTGVYGVEKSTGIFITRYLFSK